ncbi:MULTISPECIES: hypothetical protein [unclassified Paraburkholderia]|uniref:hypothetical protein n=1 Tax=unclassified Paraburkholderia TaxID=2615204 RepID=UPI002AB00FE6|nr:MULTISPECIES: hypothetical protein [unclassified Paraburkholderia]
MHDSSRSENCVPALQTRPIALTRGARHALVLRRGAAIVAVEGDLLISYRDRALASLGQLAPEQTLLVYEGERYIASERNHYAICAAQPHGARLLVQAPPQTALIAWMTMAARLLRAGAWLRARPPRSDIASR